MITVPSGRGGRSTKGRPPVDPTYLAMAAATMHSMGRLVDKPKGSTGPSAKDLSGEQGTNPTVEATGG